MIRLNPPTFSVSSPVRHFYFALPPTVVLNLPFPIEPEMSSSSCSGPGAAFLRFRFSLLSTKPKTTADEHYMQTSAVSAYSNHSMDLGSAA